MVELDVNKIFLSCDSASFIQGLDLNHGSMVKEVTSLPPVPQQDVLGHVAMKKNSGKKYAMLLLTHIYDWLKFSEQPIRMG